MPDPGKLDFFVSYNKADRSWAEWIAWTLEEAGYATVLQAWDFRPGRNFVLEMQRSTAEAERTVAVLSPDYLASLFTQPEWAAAFAADPTGQDGKLVPVCVRECAPQGLLSQIIRIDLIGLSETDASEALKAGVQRGRAKPPVRPIYPGQTRGSTPRRARPSFPGGPSYDPLEEAAPRPSPYRSMAPPREAFVHRREYDLVVQALLPGPEGQQASTVGITTALRGAGGFGKTALAHEVCWDERIQRAYPDGILWTTMGETLEPAGRLSRIRDLLRWWNRAEPPAFETATVAGAVLREALADQRVLLVVDDVWRPEDLEPFRGLGPGAALLVTTRDHRSLPPDRREIQVDAMASTEAVALLGAGLPDVNTRRLGALAARLGEWPLLLAIVNRQVRASVTEDQLSLEQALREIEEALDAEGITTFELRDRESRESAAAWTIERSVQRLAPEERERYGRLAVFPEDKDVPLSILERLWSLGRIEVRRLCSRLYDLSLLRSFDRSAETIRLHDVLRAYLLRKHAPEVVAWHRRLLDAGLPTSGRWQDLPATETYLWRNLAYHLIESGRAAACRDLLLTFEYLAAKLAATDVAALLADYSTLRDQDPELRLVAGAIRLSAHILNDDKSQLSPQLLGRLLCRKEPGIAGLLQAAAGWRAGEWFQPLHASLIGPGGALIRTFTGHAKRVNAVVVLDAGHALSGSSDGTLRLWDLESGESLGLEGHSDWVNAVAVLDGGRAVSGSEDKTLRVWDLESRQTIRTLEGHTIGIKAIAVLENRYILSGSHDGMLRLWDLESGDAHVLEEPCDAGVTALAVLEGGRAVVCSAEELRLWDLKRGELLSTFHRAPGYQSVAMLDSDRVLCGSKGRMLRLLDLKSGQILQSFEGHTDGIQSVAVLDDGHVLSGSRDRTLRLWNLKSGQTLRALEGHTSGVESIAVLGPRHVVSGSRDATLRLWDLESAEMGRAVHFHQGWAWGMASLAGGRVVSGSFDTTLKLWDVQSGEAVKTLSGHQGWVWSVAALDDRHVVSSSQDGTLRLWDLDSGETVRLFEGHTKGVRAVAALRDGRIVSGSQDRTLRLWDVESGELLRTFEGHAGLIWTVAALHDGRVLSGSKDGTLRLWDLENGECLRIFAGHTAEVRTVALFAGGRFVSGSKDGTLRVWDLESGEALLTLVSDDQGVTAIAVLDEDRIASGSGDTNLRLWSLGSGRCLSSLTLDSSPVSLALSTEPQVLAVGDDSGRVHFLTVASASLAVTPSSP